MARYEYAVYKGEQLLCIGTKEECAQILGTKPSTVKQYSTQSTFDKAARLYSRGFNNVKVAVRLDMDEIDSEMEEADSICNSKKAWKNLSQNI